MYDITKRRRRHYITNQVSLTRFLRRRRIYRCIFIASKQQRRDAVKSVLLNLEISRLSRKISQEETHLGIIQAQIVDLREAIAIAVVMRIIVLQEIARINVL